MIDPVTSVTAFTVSICSAFTVIFVKLAVGELKLIHHLPKTIAELEKAIKELKAKRNDVQRRVKTEEEIKGHRRYQEVQLWLEAVRNVEMEVDDLLSKVGGPLEALFSGNIRKFAKRVLTMLEKVSDLKSRGSFTEVTGTAT